MGVHHYMVEIVPRSFLGEPPLEAIPLPQIPEGLSPWKDSISPSEEFLDALRGLLPTDKSWDTVEEYVSESEWGSDIRIWWENNLLENIEFRFSPVGDPWSLMQRFLAVVSSAGFLLVERESGQVIAPTEEILKNRLFVSRATRFATDPQGTILRASEEFKIRHENA